MSYSTLARTAPTPHFFARRRHKLESTLAKTLCCHSSQCGIKRSHSARRAKVLNQNYKPRVVTAWPEGQGHQTGEIQTGVLRCRDERDYEGRIRYQPPPTLPFDVHGILFALVAIVFVVYPLAQWALGLLKNDVDDPTRVKQD